MDTSTLIVADVTQSLDMVELRPQAVIVNVSVYTVVISTENTPLEPMRVKLLPVPVIITFT